MTKESNNLGTEKDDIETQSEDDYEKSLTDVPP